MASRRILIAHLTDVQNTDMRYAAPDRKVLEAWGTLPHLVRQGAARVTLTHLGRVQIWRLDTAGNRIAPLPFKQSSDTLTFDLSTKAPDGSATLYYEITGK